MTTIRTITLWLLFGCFVAGAFYIGLWAGYDLCLIERPQTVRGIQISLTLGGYDVGVIDDIPGPLFRAGYNRREGDRYALRSYARMPKKR